MKDRTTIEISRETKRRIDHVKADLQVNYDVLVNKMCEAYEEQNKCKYGGVKRE